MAASLIVLNFCFMKPSLPASVAPLPAGSLSTSLLSAVLAHLGIIKEVDEGELAARRTLRKGRELGWLFHGGDTPFSTYTRVIVGE